MKIIIFFIIFLIFNSGAFARPFAEYEHVKYLFMSFSNSYNNRPMKQTIIDNLPAGVEVKLYYQYFIMYEDFEDYPNVDYFEWSSEVTWARDILPYAVKRGDSWTMVMPYEEDGMYDFVTQFNNPLITSYSYIAGGNLLADRHANCFMISDNGVFLPGTTKRFYGCNTLTLFPKLNGIGHIDERLKIISDHIILTDEPSYINKLQELGYQVTLFPKPSTPYGNYINSLLINGTIFVPTFNDPNDELALNLYRQLGLRVIPIDTREMSETGKGSLHCMTMTYPDIRNE